MSPRELSQGQIVPAARPVDAFIAPANPLAAAPARPEMMPRGPQMNVIGQGNGGNVQGYNNAEELAIALRPFNANLVNMTANIGQLYATSEYEKGRNEVVKAQILNNQQTLQSMGQYAAENRALAVKDPIAGLMMDSVNPYRRAGRENQVSQIAAREVRTTFLDAYRALGNPEQLDANSPQLAQARSQAVQRVMDKYGLNAGSAGFYDTVMPQINQSWDYLVKQHWEDRQAYLKDTIPGTKQAEILGMFADAKAGGRIEWTEYDPATGRPMQMVATPAQGALWSKGLITKASQLLDGIRNEAGIPGQNSQLQRKTIEGLLAVTQGNPELRRMILSMPFGPPENRTTVAAAMGQQVLDVDIKYGQYFRQQQENNQKDGIERYSNEIAAATAGLADGPEKAAAIAAVDAKPEYKGLPLIKRLGAQKETTSLVEDVTRRSYNADGMDQWIQSQRAKYGTQWNAREADAEFEQALQSYVSPDKRGEYRKQWGQLRAQKEEDKTKYPTSLLNPAIASAIKANLARQYPGDITEASLRGMDVTSMMAYGKANVAESARRQNEAYQSHVRNRLAEQEGKLGRRLTEPEIISTTNKAIREYGKDSKESLDYLFPGVGRTQGVGGPAAGNAPAETLKPIPGRVPQSTPRYDAGQLDYVPNREQRLQGWKDEAVMNKGSALSEVQSVLNGGGLGAAVIRAARDAKVDPATFVLQQLDFYPGNEGLSNDARQEFVRKVKGVQGMQTSFNNTPAPGQRDSHIAKGGAWLMDVLMGTAPAAAAEGPGGYSYAPRAGAGGGGGRNVAFDVAANGNDYGGLAKLISSGEGGFNSVNYGTTGSAGRLNLTSMTIGQVEKLQAARKVSAVGFAQWMPGNLTKARKAAGLSPDAPMSGNNQVAMFWAYVLKSNKQPALRDYLNGASNNLNAAHEALAGEWAAVQRPTGRGRYDGDSAGNFASIDYRRVREALIRARQAIIGGRG